MKASDRTLGSSPILSNVNVDTNWVIQGRIIPGSCAGGETMLFLQAHHNTWDNDHFHSGHCPVPPDLGVEMAVAIMVPFSSKYTVTSMDTEEQHRGFLYASMAKLITPTDSLAFVTAGGLTAVVGVEGITDLFYTDPECDSCQSREVEDYLYPTDQRITALMEIKGKDTFH